VHRALTLLLVLNAVCAAWGFSRSVPDAPSAEEPLPSGLPPIRLLSEVPAPTPRVAACESFGVFDNESDVERTTAEIMAKGLEPVVKEEPAPPETHGYLVYIDTRSRTEANRVRRELESREIDCAIIYTGRLADALSVGVFERRELADAHLERLAELGYEADLETLTRSRKRYRVLAPVDACGV
jgi:hypothetical protein